MAPAGRSRRFAIVLAAGALFGLGVAFKPNLAFPLLTLGLGWVVLARWRKLALQATGAALGGLAALALSSAWFGSISPSTGIAVMESATAMNNENPSRS